MNQIPSAELRERLEQQKIELTERVSKIKADVGRGLDPNSKEQAVQLENKEVLDALGNEATSELAKIGAALQRMDDGTYGVCTACGAEIDSRRLNARPYSSRCIACASED
jgi:DnaK suppressor protein